MGVMKNFMTFFRKCDSNEKKESPLICFYFEMLKRFLVFAMSSIVLSTEQSPATEKRLIYIERFYVTSRPPYLCSKTMKRRPCWCSKAVLSLSCESRTLFRMLKLSFVPTNCVTAGHVTEDDLLKMIPRCVF